MKFEPGDKIIVLHTGEEGEVVEIMNERIAMIEIKGVRFPAYIDQIDFPYYKRFTEKKLPEPKPKKYVDDVKKEKRNETPRHADGMWLSFLPVTDLDEFGDEVVELIKVYLINHTHDTLVFDYVLQFMGQKDFTLHNTVEPFNDFYVHDIAFKELSDSPRFDITFSLKQPDKAKMNEHAVTYRIKARQFFDKLQAMKEQQAATITHLLFEEYPDAVHHIDLLPEVPALKKSKLYDANKFRAHYTPPRTVVDLHIEKLTDNWQKLSNREILDIQLAEFEKWYEAAVVHQQPFLIVVHGMGTGRLKEEIHELIKYRREVSSFINQYHPSFGYGSTEIKFK
jgi:hypothetical protein